MPRTPRLILLLGACAGLPLAALSFRAPRLDPSSPTPGFSPLLENGPSLPDPSPPTSVAPPPSAKPRRTPTPITGRVTLRGFLRKVVWEPDRDEPIRDAVVRVVATSPAGTGEILAKCVTDHRGAFSLEAEVPYAGLPATLRLRAEKEGWTEPWTVPGLPLAIRSLPYSGEDLVWHMTRGGRLAPTADSGVDGSVVRTWSTDVVVVEASDVCCFRLAPVAGR